MRPYQVVYLLVAALLLLVTAGVEAKRRKHKGDDHHDSHRAKTKTKWSSSTDLGAGNTQVSTEEHGYYVKRTYSPLNGADSKRRNPPYLAIPIAWFGCESGKAAGCQQTSHSTAINSAAHALSEGYLCDDDCVEGYEPICGQTPNEVAVFYNKCKLNVAKCRTHGLWQDLPYAQCQQTYPKETAYTEKKFKCSPYFRENSNKVAAVAAPVDSDEKDKDNSKESSEEQDEQKINKKEQKLEQVVPIVLPLLEKPVDIPVPASESDSVPVETIALPPLPVKDIGAQRQSEQTISNYQAAKPLETLLSPALQHGNANIAAKVVLPATLTKPRKVISSSVVLMKEADKIAAPANDADKIVASSAVMLEENTTKSDKDKLKYVVS